MGVVIAPTKLTDFAPLYCEPSKEPSSVTQFDKDDVEAVGLVKFDFLGLRTLTIIDWALQILIINYARDRQNRLLISTILPLDDAHTFAMLCQIFNHGGISIGISRHERFGKTFTT